MVYSVSYTFEKWVETDGTGTLAFRKDYRRSDLVASLGGGLWYTRNGTLFLGAKVGMEVEDLLVVHQRGFTFNLQTGIALRLFLREL
jgi:hypothetical protein